MSTEIQQVPSVLVTRDDDVSIQLGNALRNNRVVKEQKIAAQRKWNMFSEEEVSVFEANIKEARQLYEQQLDEQRLADDRQREAATDLLTAESRKRELVGLVSKIAAIKTHVTSQDQAREKELEFRAKQKQKREAFEKRNKVIEAAQITEREDLMKTQDRVARNLSLVHSLELRGMSEDARKARNREFQQQYQQLKMRQQKEAEQLREVQLLKIRHMSEQMEMELLSATDLEDLAAQHRMREDSLLAEQVMERASEASKLDRQQAQLMALQLQEEQKLVKGGLLHNQARQRKQLERSQKSSARQRERIMVDETATMLAEVGQKAAGSGGDEGSQRASDLDASEIQTSYLGTSEGGDFMGSGQDMSGVPSGAQETEADTERRRKQRTTNDAAAELKESLEKGLQRLQNVEKQHKKMFDSIRSQHKDQFLQKLREVKRKQSQLLKDQEDEVQTIRKEQVADMEELFEILKQAQDLNSQHTIGQGTERINVGNAMPGSFFESIKSGYTPSPVTYSHACVIRTAISGFKLLNPKQMMTIIQRLSVAVDATMPKFPTICKVENIGEGYLLCAGLNSDTPEDEEMDETDIVQRDVAGALECVQALRAAVEEIDVSDLNLPDGKLALKVGVTQGPVMAGLLGSRVPHFRILGATVDRATNICTAAEPAGILVSGSVKDLLANEKYSFKAHKEPDTFWFADSS